jgi:outer membrane protein assembly factor BamB
VKPARRFAILVSVVALSVGFPASAADWPQFLGPSRNGSTPKTISSQWPKDGPRQVWKTRVGEGFSGPVIAEGTVYLFHREGDAEVLSAWQGTNGVPRWSQRLPTSYSDDLGSGDGPKSTPAVSGGRVFALGPAGMLRAVSVQDGKLLWQVDLARRFGSEHGFFGFATSPLVLEDRIVVQAGGPGASTVALATEDGHLLWKSGSDESGYGSPVPWIQEGRTNVLSFNRSGAVAHALSDGTEVFRFPWRARMHASVNAATPLVFPGGFFLTASYGTGAAWVRPAKGGGEVVWSGDESLSAHFATPVEAGGFLYGFHGRHESGPDFRCIEARTGKVQWSLERTGSGSVLRAGDQLLMLLESGELRLLAADPTRPTERARAQVAGNTARMVPALSDGRLYLRDRSALICLELPRKETGTPTAPSGSSPAAASHAPTEGR